MYPSPELVQALMDDAQRRAAHHRLVRRVRALQKARSTCRQTWLDRRSRRNELDPHRGEEVSGWIRWLQQHT